MLTPDRQVEAAAEMANLLIKDGKLEQPIRCLHSRFLLVCVFTRFNGPEFALTLRCPRAEDGGGRVGPDP